MVSKNGANIYILYIKKNTQTQLSQKYNNILLLIIHLHVPLWIRSTQLTQPSHIQPPFAKSRENSFFNLILTITLSSSVVKTWQTVLFLFFFCVTTSPLSQVSTLSLRKLSSIRFCKGGFIRRSKSVNVASFYNLF